VFPALIVDAPWFDLAGQTMDLDRGTNGWFYATDYRATGTDRGGLYVHDETGQQLWDSLSATRIVLTNDQAIDLLRGTGGGAVSRNGDVLAVINLDTSVLTVMPLANGVPDLANRLVLDGFGPASGPGRDVAFDAAGNLYAISSGAQALRVFSPGGQTLAITGSDGTFVLQRPPTVAVVATTSTISESGPNPGIFSISRLGDTNSDLVVAYALGGSAINGMDYATNTLSATIPAGATNVEVVITPLDDSISEPVESVTLDLIGSAQYDLLAQQTATINIVDDDQAVITIAAVDSNACERLPGDRLSFRIDRAGETNSELFIICDTRPGTAIRDIDWNGQNPDPLALFVESLAAGEVSRTFFLEPIDDAILESCRSSITVPAYPIPPSPGLLMTNCRRRPFSSRMISTTTRPPAGRCCSERTTAFTTRRCAGPLTMGPSTFHPRQTRFSCRRWGSSSKSTRRTRRPAARPGSIFTRPGEASPGTLRSGSICS
jgi:hypothetical protein